MYGGEIMVDGCMQIASEHVFLIKLHPPKKKKKKTKQKKTKKKKNKQTKKNEKTKNKKQKKTITLDKLASLLTLVAQHTPLS